MLRELATCESGGHGESDRPISAAAASIVGRFQFMPPTVRAYVQQRTAARSACARPTDLAHDYDQAKELAKYMIFERARLNDWPVCARKLGLRQQVSEIRSAQAL